MAILETSIVDHHGWRVLLIDGHCRLPSRGQSARHSGVHPLSEALRAQDVAGGMPQ
ncbi:hypothetical protein BGZ61DRAFT_443900 [Ilyonectria robusta]|uniref:uncharacterized protein n=1 Tax=Ilyonectria robusta TaxID=1079257 RepID=UPI001E8D053A|nr:uncharacterized protein BGZ61DRAFT_443900 [Ilyonectria robusta]KAH8735202.1 hypothetical protein BGZ61DRAFT_443900 [Ilyonectria robusta]